MTGAADADAIQAVLREPEPLQSMVDLESHVAQALSGRYRLERELGRGGMAIVYLAEDLRHRRRVAIKVLRPELAPSLGAERFLLEIEIAAQLAHPHILPLHDSGEARVPGYGPGTGLLYYVMPYVEGESLRDRLDREHQMPVDDALRIACEVADALAYAHAHAVVHRDIKPENILLQAGHALVSDFGVARAVSAAAGERLTATGLAVGTPAYMSPEQASGERDVDARSDIYALGCVLYEMLAGEPPYTGPSAQAILARKMIEPLPRLRVVRETVPLALEEVVARALARAPVDRFATAAQFGEALKHGLAAPAPAGARPRFSTTRRVTAGIVVGLAVIAAVVFPGRAWWASRSSARVAAVETSRIESLAVLPLANLSGDSTQEYFAAGMHAGLIGELARIGTLRVVSRTSVMQYRNSEKSIPEIARELSVDGVLEGAVRRAGDSVHVQVQLVRAQPAERNVWARTYDRHIRDVFKMYDDIARVVADTIGATVVPRATARVGTTRSVDPRAYDAYLRGRYYWEKRSAADLQRALGHFREALDIDPTFAPAYVGMADSYALLGAPAYSYRPPTEMYARARAAAERALKLDSTLADPYATLGLVASTYELDWMRAEQSFRTAIALDPNHAQARHWYSMLLASLGRTAEASREAHRARELDPLTAVHAGNAARVAYYSRRYENAIADLRTTLDIGSATTWPHVGIAMARAAQRQYDAALAELDSADASFGGLTESVRGYIHAAAGRPGETRRIIADLRRRSRAEYISPVYVAILYGAVGENDAAFEWIERAVRERDGNLRFARVEPMLDPLRADARFDVLLRRLRLR